MCFFPANFCADTTDACVAYLCGGIERWIEEMWQPKKIKFPDYLNTCIYMHQIHKKNILADVMYNIISA